MKLHYAAIAVLVVGLIIFGCVDYLTDLSYNYEQTADLSSMNNTLKNMNTTRTNAEELGKEISDFQLKFDITAFLVPYELTQIGWKSSKVLFSSWTTATSMADDTTRGLSENGIALPEWFGGTVTAIILIFFAAIVIYGIFKWKMED